MKRPTRDELETIIRNIAYYAYRLSEMKPCKKPQGCPDKKGRICAVCRIVFSIDKQMDKSQVHDE